jgi:hypothetical protein
MLFFFGSFIKGSHVCIVLVFPNISAFQAFYYMCVCVCVCVCVCEIRGVTGLLSTSCWPGMMWGVVEPGEFVEA